MADPLGGPVGIPLIGPVTSYARPTDPMASIRDMMAKVALVPARGPDPSRRDEGEESLGDKLELGALMPPGVPVELFGAQVPAHPQQLNTWLAQSAPLVSTRAFTSARTADGRSSPVLGQELAGPAQRTRAALQSVAEVLGNAVLQGGGITPLAREGVRRYAALVNSALSDQQLWQYDLDSGGFEGDSWPPSRPEDYSVRYLPCVLRAFADYFTRAGSCYTGFDPIPCLWDEWRKLLFDLVVCKNFYLPPGWAPVPVPSTPPIPLGHGDEAHPGVAESLAAEGEGMLQGCTATLVVLAGVRLLPLLATNPPLLAAASVVLIFAFIVSEAEARACRKGESQVPTRGLLERFWDWLKSTFPDHREPPLRTGPPSGKDTWYPGVGTSPYTGEHWAE